MIKVKYAMVIQWSDENNCYVVSLPEWGPWCKAYGATYQEAVQEATEVLDLLMDQENDPLKDSLPDPIEFIYPGSNVVPMPDPANEPVPLRKLTKEPTRA